MLIETVAYGNRWQAVCPLAKSGFAAAGLVLALLATHPAPALVVAVMMTATTLLGARVPPVLLARVALPALAFLVLGCAPLFVGLEQTAQGIRLHWLPASWPQALLLCCRAVAALLALLFLALTTPLPRLLAALRALHVPAVLLEMMALAYRMLFVLLDSLHGIHTAQLARLSNTTWRTRWRAVSALAAQLVFQVLWRAKGLQQAAQARGLEGEWRFLPPHTPDAGHHRVFATLGVAAMAGAWWLAAGVHHVR